MNSHRTTDPQPRELADRYRALFDRSLFAVFLIDFDARFVDANESACRLLGLPRHDLIGEPLDRFLSGPDLDAARAAISALRDGTRRSEPHIYRLTTARGELAWIETESALIERDGVPHAIQGVARDITAQRLLEESLREERQRYFDLVNSVGDWVWEMNAEGIHTYSNPAVTTLLGYPVHEVIGRPVTDLWAEESRTDEALTWLRERLQSGRGWRNFSGRFRHKDGHIVHMESTAVPIHDDDGRLIGYRGVDRDVTARVVAEEALRRSHEALERLHDVAAELDLCATEDAVYRLTVEAAEKILQFAVCTLDVVEGGELVKRAASREAPPTAPRRLPLDADGLATESFRTGRTFIIGDIRSVDGARPITPDVRSGISMPIDDLGVFQAASPAPDAFSQGDARLLRLLLKHAAAAVRRIRLQQELVRQATHDPLTGAYNRRYFMDAVRRERTRAKRYRHAIGFVLVDVNRFKEINDRFGHGVGDRVLREIAALLEREIRASDILIRYGGDEFLIILPETDGRFEPLEERVGRALAAWNRDQRLVDFPVALAFGASVWAPDDDAPIEEVLHEADRRMYEDKESRGAAGSAPPRRPPTDRGCSRSSSSPGPVAGRGDRGRT